MRNVVIAASMGLSLCGCATHESVYREALNNCQAVGISEQDPQFGTCTQAYARQHLEDRLTETYHDALNPTPEDRRIAHQWHGY